MYNIRYMNKLKAKLNKQNLRRYLGLMASYTEILLALVVIIGILLLCIRVLAQLRIFIISTFTGTAVPLFAEFLSTVFELVIGIEFVKMLAGQRYRGAFIYDSACADYGSQQYAEFSSRSDRYCNFICRP